MIRAAVILNPAAGRGAAGRAADRVVRAFHERGWVVDLQRTDRPGHAVELARDAAGNGARHVIAVGGDGTVHEVANGILAADGATDGPALAVIPVGSGDDFAKLVGMYRLGPEAAVARIVTGVRRRFDVGRACGEYFVNSLGCGFGAAVVRARAALTGLRGFMSYLMPIVRTFAGYRPLVFDIAAVEHAESGPVMMVEVCNGTTAGGSYRFAPQADPADGWLDVCVIREVSTPRFLVALPRVLRGTHTGMREFTSFRTQCVRLQCRDGPLVLHLDGELREPGTASCTVVIVPSRLAVVTAR